MAGAYSTHTLHKIVSVNPISYGISIPAMLLGAEIHQPPQLKTHLWVKDSIFLYIHIKYVYLAKLKKIILKKIAKKSNFQKKKSIF